MSRLLPTFFPVLPHQPEYTSGSIAITPVDLQALAIAAPPGGTPLPRGDPRRGQLNVLLWFPNFLRDSTECLSSWYLDQIALPVLQVSNFVPIIDFPTIPRNLSSDIIL